MSGKDDARGKGSGTLDREELGQRLHDTVSQSLTGIYLKATVLARSADKTCPELAKELTELSKLIHQAVGELHELVNELRPGTKE